MRRIAFFLAFIGSLTLSAVPCFAGQTATTGKQAAQPEDEEKEIVDEGTITGKANPPVTSLPSEDAPIVTPEELAAFKSMPFEPEAYRGAKALNMDPEFVHNARQGLELIYLRDYKGAKKYFEEMSSRYADDALGPVGTALIWQALMIENFDFKYSKQYEVASVDAQRRLQKSASIPGNEAWENFLLGGMQGVDAIHQMRQGSFLPALNKAFDAMKALDKSRAAAPDFPDLLLGDGIYNYWRSVVSMNSKALPDFGDKRAEGLEQMKQAELRSVFIAAPASMSLAFAYIEERDFKRALTATLRVHRQYPNNVICSLLLARIHMYLKNYPSAEKVLKQITVTAPENERVYYYLGMVYLRTKRLDEALKALDQYLSYEQLPDEYRATTLYRKGNLLYRLERYKEAEEAYKEAVKVNKHKGAKRRLDRLKKEGKI